MLIERRSGIATVKRKAEKELNTDKLISRRDNISLQGTVTITTAIRDIEEEEDVAMKVMLLQLIDATVSVFNLTFLIATEAAATS
ncbi:hypothetical protein BDBG_07644 [Blastomyces gilchristii SLH14081]|uniref:Uncharacterized protein n=1 Tax=Blastomyces gilchristii (strain SLH14081) TaxID=559298 RepID=A0A179UYU4_BLAGS|nr:uncharacterized protein BDBG_07644 [Blastomyces gilchristii SLH14081]OAT12277.1 hypothetical protein BDBG_07644 [Blastomyces gilchristii SLH14081]